jgi:hypothetical protein
MSFYGHHKPARSDASHRRGARTILVLGGLLLGTGFLCAQQEYAEDSLLGGSSDNTRRESRWEIYGVTEPGAIGNSLMLTISNRDERASITNARAELVSDPSFIANLQFDPPTLSDIEPGESKQVRVLFDVKRDAPLGEVEVLRFRIFDEEGKYLHSSETSLWLTYESNAPLVLRLVKIEAKSHRPSDACRLDYRDGQAGLAMLCEKKGSREAASLSLGNFPYEVVFGEPIEFEAEVKYEVRYSPGHPCHKASGGAEQSGDCREVFRRTAWKFQRGRSSGRVEMDGKGPGTVRTALRFAPDEEWAAAGFVRAERLRWDSDELGVGDFPLRLPLTVVIARGSNWTRARVLRQIRKTAATLAGCDIVLGPVTLLKAQLPTGEHNIDMAVQPTGPLTPEDVRETAGRVPKAAERPVAVLVGRLNGDRALARSYRPAPGVSAAQQSEHPYLNTIWISYRAHWMDRSDKMYSPLAHELGHLLCECGHTGGERRHLLHEKRNFLGADVLPEHCAAFRESLLIQRVARP